MGTMSVPFAFAPAVRLARSMARGAVCALGLAALGSAAGCAGARTQAVKPLGTTILIMNFDVPKEYQSESEQHKVEGWWFGAHSVFHNPNAGEIFADVLSSEMRRQMDWVSLFSRLHVRQYFAQKKTLLEREFTNLKEPEIEELLRQISPLSFARELGADKVIVGKIIRCKTFFQRTIKYWSSTVELDCSMVDVDSGKVLWRAQAEKTGRLDSTTKVMEQIAKSLVERMRKEYFLKPQPATRP